VDFFEISEKKYFFTFFEKMVKIGFFTQDWPEFEPKLFFEKYSKNKKFLFFRKRVTNSKKRILQIFSATFYRSLTH
jgi:hypothetical protein